MGLEWRQTHMLMFKFPCYIFMQTISMLEEKLGDSSTIVYRPIRPSDLLVLERIHAALFPIRYELEFFLNVVNGRDIISWAAVDRSRPNNQSDELIGFVTARLIPARESEIVDLLQCDSSRNDEMFMYILTLGVVENYRNLGIASSLVREVINFASSMSACRAVYLHVIDYNEPAIHFYKKMSFRLERRIPKFYYIRGHHYDSYLFVYYINNSRSPCYPRDFLRNFAAYVRGLFTTLIAKLWRTADWKPRRKPKCKEESQFLDSENNALTGGGTALCQCV